MNPILGHIIVLSALALLVFVCGREVWRGIKSGSCSGCDGSCNGCGKCTHCHHQNQQ